LLLTFPGTHMLNDAVGKSDAIAAIGHRQATTISNQAPDVMVWSFIIGPGHFVHI
jgi:hypothetical protein